MKKLLPTLLLSAGLGLSAAQAQTTGKTAVVRLFETSGRSFISYGEAKTEQLPLEGTTSKKQQQLNTEQIQRLVDRLYAEGYHLVSSFSGGEPTEPVTTLVFRKE
ncbi:hypothetical protein [Hymenobacter algoricola]|uniref:DUF4177 domain-containing protein n=1 Tax=Hymenobacter algoricola TaxID=486267 RepID=A0ABP7NQC2_9BACT